MSDNRNSSNSGSENGIRGESKQRPRPNSQPQVRKNSNDPREQRQRPPKNNLNENLRLDVNSRQDARERQQSQRSSQNTNQNSNIKRSSNIKAQSTNPNRKLKRNEGKHKAPNQRRRRKAYETQIDEVVVSVGEMDYFLLFIIISLILIGIIMVFSASSYQSATNFGTPYHFFIRQSVFALLGLIGLTVTANVYYGNYLKKWPTVLYAVTTVLLLLVLQFGKEINGAKRWLEIPGTGGLGFQPSEIAKVTMILTVSSIVARRPKILNDWKGVFQVSGVIMFMAILIGIENMSTAIIVMLIGFGIVFVVSPFTKQLLALAFAGAMSLVSFLAYQAYFAEGFRGARFKAWLDPFAYELDTGFQTVQSLYAIASGGFFGLGLGNSRQKLSYIPESHNDIIFAIICEEMGFFGAAIIIMLYIILIYRGIQIALKAPNLFGTLVAFGIVIMIAVQVIINVAVVTNTIPNTGIALPFISYGGTSLVFMITTMGILLNISRYTRK